MITYLHKKGKYDLKFPSSNDHRVNLYIDRMIACPSIFEKLLNLNMFKA